ncbi:YrzI family small protein [Ectobacillus sp. sgz5001026]
MRLQLLIFTVIIEKRKRTIEECKHDEQVKQKMNELKNRHIFLNL